MSYDMGFIGEHIRDVPDFPEKGILFKDITPLLKSPRAMKEACDLMTLPFRNQGITVVVGMESRGFIFGVPVAERLGVGFVPIRKPGKLPCPTVSQEYQLEYGTDTLEMHRDAIGEDDDVLIVDDLLATGGTAEAVVKMIQSLGANVSGLSFLIELNFLKGRIKLIEAGKVWSVLVY